MNERVSTNSERTAGGVHGRRWRNVRSVMLAVALGAAIVPRHAAAQLPPAPAQDVNPLPEAKKYLQIGVDLLRDPDGAQYEEALKARAVHGCHSGV